METSVFLEVSLYGSYSEELSLSAPPPKGTSCINIHAMTSSNQNLQDDETRWDENFNRVDHAPCPARHKVLCHESWRAIVRRAFYCLKDTQQGRTTRKAEAAATYCVCTKNRSGQLISMDIRIMLDLFTAQHTCCLIPEVHETTLSYKQTAAVVRCFKTRRRVQFATCQVGQERWWFQQEHSVRTAGPKSTVDTWSQTGDTRTDSAAATFVWTRRRKLQLAIRHKFHKQFSILSMSSADCYHVQCTSVEESWPVSFALNDKSLEEEQFAMLLYSIYELSVLHSLREWFHDSWVGQHCNQ